jgi:hypothetical protein
VVLPLTITIIVGRDERKEVRTIVPIVRPLVPGSKMKFRALHFDYHIESVHRYCEERAAFCTFSQLLSPKNEDHTPTTQGNDQSSSFELGVPVIRIAGFLAPPSTSTTVPVSNEPQESNNIDRALQSSVLDVVQDDVLMNDGETNGAEEEANEGACLTRHRLPTDSTDEFSTKVRKCQLSLLLY